MKRILAMALIAIMALSMVTVSANTTNAIEVKSTKLTRAETPGETATATVEILFTVTGDPADITVMAILDAAGIEDTSNVAAPNESNIKYVDQLQRTGITIDETTSVYTITFVVLDSLFENDQNLYVKVGGTEATASNLLELTIPSGTEGVTYFVGDVNGDGSVTSTDSVLILQYDASADKGSFAFSETLTQDVSLAAANVNGDSSVTSTDSVLVLQYDASSDKAAFNETLPKAMMTECTFGE